MGFFSWTCAKTNMPIMASTSWRDYPDFTEVVLLADDGTRTAKGTYDGYGRIEIDHSPLNKGFRPGRDIEFMDSGIDGDLETGRAKLVLAKHFDPQTDTFEGLGLSRFEPGQGHFHDEDFIRQCQNSKGFASYEGYLLARDWTLPFDVATAVTAEQGKAYMRTNKELALAVLAERARRVHASVDVPGEIASYSRPNGLRLLPVDGSVDRLDIAAKRDRLPDGSRRVLARLDLAGSEGREGAIEAAARAVVDACAPQVRTKVVVKRGGETLAEITHYRTKAREMWYEAEADGQRQAFWKTHAVLGRFGIEATDANFKALYPDKARKRPVTIDLPEPEPMPGMK